jgi:signal peptidase I
MKLKPLKHRPLPRVLSRKEYPQMQPSKPRFPRLRRFCRQHVAPLAFVIIAVCSFRSAIADWNIVPTGSMKPTIIEGDRIFVNKLAYGLKVPFTTWHLAQWSEPARGDIIVFNSPADGMRLVKRVAGVPGDRVTMRGSATVTIPADHYFVLGDNRGNSADSRVIGLIPRENILGRSSRVVLSFDPYTHLPRWNRTLKPLPEISAGAINK